MENNYNAQNDYNMQNEAAANNMQNAVSVNGDKPKEEMDMKKKVVIVILTLVLSVGAFFVSLLLYETLTGKDAFPFISAEKSIDEDEDEDDDDADDEKDEKYDEDDDDALGPVFVGGNSTEDDIYETTGVTELVTVNGNTNSTTTPESNENNKPSGVTPTKSPVTKPAKPSGGASGNTEVTRKPEKPTVAPGTTAPAKPSTTEQETEYEPWWEIITERQTTEGALDDNCTDYGGLSGGDGGNGGAGDSIVF